VKRRAYAKRRDANEPEIKDRFEELGCLVMPLDPFDLLVETPDGRTLMVEVKTANGRLTVAQENLLVDGWSLHIVRTVDDVDRLLKSREFIA